MTFPVHDEYLKLHKEDIVNHQILGYSYSEMFKSHVYRIKITFQKSGLRTFETKEIKTRSIEQPKDPKVSQFFIANMWSQMIN